MDKIIIGICDDDKRIRDFISGRVNNFFAGKNTVFAIIEYKNGDEMLSVLDKQENTVNLLFLDIEMPGRNGIEIKKILCRDKRVEAIVFITSHVSFIREAFGIKVMGFVEKPLSEDNINQWLEVVYKDFVDYKWVEINKGVQVKIKDIEYIKAEGIYSRVIMGDGEECELMRESINKWLDKLDMTFARCHKSIIVNMRYVADIRYTELVLVDKKVLPVGRKYYKEFKNAYKKYSFDNIKKRIGWQD